MLDSVTNYNNCHSKIHTNQQQNTESRSLTSEIHLSSTGCNILPENLIKQEREDYFKNTLINKLEEIDTTIFESVEVKYENITANDAAELQNILTIGVNETTNYRCDICGKSFKDNRWLTAHMKKVHENTPMLSPKKEFTCETCHKLFSTRTRLQNHSRIHTGLKPFACTVCGKAFADRSAFHRHEKIHFREERVECGLCGKLYSDSYGLKKHMLAHSGQKPHACPICNKRFRSSSTLTVHKRTHTGEKPYVCLLCNKRFLVKSHLNTHARTHSGEKPFTCNVCERAFSDGSSYRRHVRNHNASNQQSSSSQQSSTNHGGKQQLFANVTLKPEFTEDPLKLTFNNQQKITPPFIKQPLHQQQPLQQPFNVGHGNPFETLTKIQQLTGYPTAKQFPDMFKFPFPDGRDPALQIPFEFFARAPAIGLIVEPIHDPLSVKVTDDTLKECPIEVTSVSNSISKPIEIVSKHPSHLVSPQTMPVNSYDHQRNGEFPIVNSFLKEN